MTRLSYKIRTHFSQRLSKFKHRHTNFEKDNKSSKNTKIKYETQAKRTWYYGRKCVKSIKVIKARREIK